MNRTQLAMLAGVLSLVLTLLIFLPTRSTSAETPAPTAGAEPVAPAAYMLELEAPAAVSHFVQM